MLASSHAVLDLVGVIVGIIVLAVYLLPTWIALARKHHWIVRILLVNVLLGWTIIGWVVALHMSSTSRTKTNAYWRPPTPGTPGAATNFVPVETDPSGTVPTVPLTSLDRPPTGAMAGDAVPVVGAPVVPPVATVPSAEAGWRVDPDDPARERYHDGSAWTLVSRPREDT
jgi:hypothetical protein